MWTSSFLHLILLFIFLFLLFQTMTVFKSPLLFLSFPFLRGLKTILESLAHWAGSAYCPADGGPCQCWSMNRNAEIVFSSSLVISCLTWSRHHFFSFPTSQLRSKVACTVYAIMLLLQKIVHSLLSFQEHNVPCLLILRAHSTLRSFVPSALLFSRGTHHVKEQFVDFSSPAAQLFSAHLFCWWGTQRAELELIISPLHLFSTCQAEFSSLRLSCGFFLFFTPFICSLHVALFLQNGRCQRGLNTHIWKVIKKYDFNWALTFAREFQQHWRVSGTAGKAFKWIILPIAKSFSYRQQ